MAIDPQVQKILDAGRLLPPLETLTVREARARCRTAFITRNTPEKVFQVEDTSLRIFCINEFYTVPIRVYKPEPGDSLPVLIYFHGGGFVLNDLDTHDGICRNLANQGECMVISVDYALAPEHPYPTALHQCYGVTQWIFSHAADFGADLSRIAVAGDSSGGMLAAAVSLMARDLKTPGILFQMLIYPALDYHEPGTPSYHRYGRGYSLTRDIMAWFFNLYIGNDPNVNSPYLFPLRTENLKGLPATYIITAEYDPLRDEAESFAGKLKDNGNTVQLKRYDGMIHGFIVMHQDIDKGKEALAQIGYAIKSEFQNHTTGIIPN